MDTDGKGAAPPQEPALQPPTKENSKEVGEEGGDRGPNTGPTGYPPPPGAIGGAGEQRLTRSKTNKYDVWPGLYTDRAPRKVAAPATENVVGTHEETPASRRGGEEHDTSQEEFDSTHSQAEELKGEQSGDNSYGEENPDEAKLQESPSINLNFPPPLLSSTFRQKVKDAEGIMEMLMDAWEA